jgi:hypothetical protein
MFSAGDKSQVMAFRGIDCKSRLLVVSKSLPTVVIYTPVIFSEKFQGGDIVVDSLFLGQDWIQERILEYSREQKPMVSLQQRGIVFPERIYLAGLLHIYTGSLTPAEIADAAGVSFKELGFWKVQIDFMVLADAAKVGFSDYFREELLMNDYEPSEYRSIASEYLLFDEQVRTQIRAPLFSQMKRVANSLSNYSRVKLKLDRSDLKIFKRLYSFFVFESDHLAAKPLEQAGERLDLVAKQIVWSGLNAKYSDTERLLSDKKLAKNIKNLVMERFDDLSVHIERHSREAE